MEDNCYVEFYGISKGKNQILLGILNTTTNIKKAGILNPSNGKIDFLETSGSIATASISPDGKFAVTIATSASEPFKVELYDLNNNTRFFSQVLNGSEPPQYFVWCTNTDKAQLYFSPKSNSANNKLYTITIGGQA